MKQHTCYLLFFFSVSTLQISAQGFQKLYGGINQESATHSVSAFDGVYFIGATSSVGSGMADLALVNVDLSGNVVWAKTYGGAYAESADEIVWAADGGLVIAASSRSFNINQTEELVLFKTNSYGNIVWQKLFPAAARITPTGLIRTFDSGFALTGLCIVNGFMHTMLIRTNASGDTLFTCLYGSNTAHDLGVALVQTPDGGFVIAGKTQTNTNGQADMMLIKTDASGNMRWAKSYGLPVWEEAEAITIAADGKYLISGSTTSSGAGSYDILLWKCDTAGNYLWGKTYGGDKTDASYSVHENADGSIVLAGYTNSMGYGHQLGQDSVQNSRGDDSTNVFLMKTNAVGDTIWTQTYGHNKQDEAIHFSLMSDGGYAIPGWSDSYTNATDSMQMLLIRTDSQGYSGCHEQRAHPIIASTTYTAQSLPFIQTRGMAMSSVSLTASPWNLVADDACMYTGISSLSSAGESVLSVFPNPVHENLSLHFSGINNEPALLTVCNLFGEIIFSKNILSTDQRLNLSFFIQGTYVLEVRTSEHLLRRKIIKM